MHVPRYGIPQTTSWPRAIAKTRGQATETCGQTFPCLIPNTGPLSASHTQDLRDLFQTSRPHAQACLGCANTPVCPPRLSDGNKTLGRRQNNLSIQALSLTSTNNAFVRLGGNNKSIKSKDSQTLSFHSRPCHTKRLFHARTRTCTAEDMAYTSVSQTSILRSEKLFWPASTPAKPSRTPCCTHWMAILRYTYIFIDDAVPMQQPSLLSPTCWITSSARRTRRSLDHAVGTHTCIPR